ncbi:NAD(P)/FAD-dependent oxidoreductase [Aeromicrobium panaciterrae]|uniref:flavin-containing monooxygenase n=1 Tax=Aeromicrobium panaciterrae TaxID=363861 RepID=UPI0031DEAE3A
MSALIDEGSQPVGLVPLDSRRAQGEIVAAWIEGFQAWVDTPPEQRKGHEELFHPDAWWRDLVALTWDIRTAHSADKIAEFARGHLAGGGMRGVRLRPDSTARVVSHHSRTWIEAMFEFETDVLSGRGVLRLTSDELGHWRAWILSTSIHELHGREASISEHRPIGVDRTLTAAPSWLHTRSSESEFVGHEPYVVIVGAGQNGLALAAHLKVRGIPALLIERNARVGDNWRNRYESLLLHDPVWLNHFPFMQFPSSWPIYTPKDKLGDWLESYAVALDLNVWVGSSLISTEYDDEAQRWSIVVARPDGATRTVRPAHVVVTTGNQGVPKFPEGIDLADFGGRAYHSSEHSSAAGSDGQRIVVVGSSTSAHDIAKDFHDQGATVTMIQRSPTHVISQRHMPGLTMNLYREDGPSTEDADLQFASFPNLALLEFAESFTSNARREDQALLQSLSERGFRTDDGPSGTGVLGKVYERGGGYYIDVGCSALIAHGRIGIESRNMRRMVTAGIELDDGDILEADVVVFATGFSGTGEMAKRLLGEDVIERSGLPGGLDDEGEPRRMFRRTGHPGLWFMGGSLQSARINSKYLALQLAAIHFGIHDGTT